MALVVQRSLKVLDSPPSLRDTSAGGGHEMAIFAATPQPLEKGGIVSGNQSIKFISNKAKERVCAVSKKEIK
mgnify:CR=1 FL=1|jgi:hypothetical protein